MADNTKIEWADATLNYANGCSVVSPGCTNCYAMRLAGTRMKHHPTRAGLTTDSKAGPVWNGQVRIHEPALLQALSWKRPRQIFWNAHGDLFHENVPDEAIDHLFAVCALTPQHTHMILTKRSKRMREYMHNVWGDDLGPNETWGQTSYWRIIQAADALIPDWREQMKFSIGGCNWWPLPNVWLGVSIEDQTRADERIPDLLATPAAVRFLSCEPLLGPIDLNGIKAPRYSEEPEDSLAIDWRFSCLDTGDYYWFQDGECTDSGDGPWRDCRIDWVIAGGESGPNARPMHPDWARSIRDQCAAATLRSDDAPVPFHFKQWGEYVPSELAPRAFLNLSVVTSDGVHLPKGRCLERADDANAEIVAHVGKKAAGRLLDGVEHNGMPA